MGPSCCNCKDFVSNFNYIYRHYCSFIQQATSDEKRPEDRLKNKFAHVYTAKKLVASDF